MTESLAGTEGLKRKKQIESWKKIVKRVRAAMRKAIPINFSLLLFAWFLIVVFKELNLPMLIWFGLWFLFISSVIIWYTTHSLKIVFQWENGGVFRMGEYLETKDPGWALIFWPFDKIEFVNMWERKIDIPPQKVLLKQKIQIRPDKDAKDQLIEVTINVIFYFRVIDPEKALVKVEDVDSASYQVVLTVTRNECAGYEDLQTFIGAREEISEKIKEEAEKVTRNWGIEILRAGIQDVLLSNDLITANHRVFVEDKEREATLVKVDAEIQRVERLYPVLDSRDKGKTWRPLEALENVAKSPGNVIITGGVDNILKKLMG